VRRWEAKKVNAPGGNVLAHLAGANDEAFRSQFVEQFFVDQMDLTQVWLGGVRATRERCFTVSPM
jgi:hypothetical protein